MIKITLSIVLLTLSSFPTLAVESEVTSEVAIHESNISFDGLTNEEYLRYSKIMKSVRGIFSPNIDPLNALGIEARNDAERRHYAELGVK